MYSDIVQKSTKHCLTTFFLWNETFYKQQSGCGTDSSLNQFAAALFIDNFEKVAFDSFNNKPRSWFRYVADSFCNLATK